VQIIGVSPVVYLQLHEFGSGFQSGFRTALVHFIHQRSRTGACAAVRPPFFGQQLGEVEEAVLSWPCERGRQPFEFASAIFAMRAQKLREHRWRRCQVSRPARPPPSSGFCRP